MTIEAVVERSTFSAGEISPVLRARSDLARHAAGVDKLENMVVLLEGGATRRSGTRFVDPLRTEAQAGLLVPFVFSRDDAVMLIINGGFLRLGQTVAGVPGIVQSGGSAYERSVPWTAADLPNLRWVQAADEVYFVCRGRRPQVLRRVSQTNWTLVDYQPANGPVEPQNLDTTRNIRASATTGTITLTSDFDVFQAGDVGSVWRLDEPDLSALPLWTASETVAAGAERRFQGRVYSVVSGTSTGANAPTHDEGDLLSGTGGVVWRYLHDGGGFVRITAVAGPRSATAVVQNATLGRRLPTSVTTGAGTWRWSRGSWSDELGWPDRIALHDQALWFFRGDRFWRTRPADFTDFVQTVDPAESGISGRLTPPDPQRGTPSVEWVMPSVVPIVGAQNGEAVLRGAGVTDPLTFQNIRPVWLNGVGSAPHVPAVMDEGGVFIGRSRRRLHYAPFDPVSERLPVDELTLSARHILRGATQLAWTRDPHRVLWIAAEAGLVALTFMPSQQVVGWARQPMTNGQVEAIAALPTPDGADELWLIVRRVVNGQTRRYVERLEPWFAHEDVPTTAAGAWFVDCGLAYAGAPVSTVTGLGHLEGQQVAILADGAVHRRLTVVSGAVTLDRPASSVVVGLPVPWRLRTLPIEIATRSGTSKGDKKRANHVVVDIVASAGGTVAVNGGPPEPPPFALTGGLVSGAVPLATGSFNVGPIEARIDNELVIELAGDDPLPFTLTGLAPEADLAEGS